MDRTARLARVAPAIRDLTRDDPTVLKAVGMFLDGTFKYEHMLEVAVVALARQNALQHDKLCELAQREVDPILVPLGT